MDDDLDRGTEVRWIVSKYGWLSIDRWPESAQERTKTSKTQLKPMQKKT